VSDRRARRGPDVAARAAARLEAERRFDHRGTALLFDGRRRGAVERALAGIALGAHRTGGAALLRAAARAARADEAEAAGESQGLQEQNCCDCAPHHLHSNRAVLLSRLGAVNVLLPQDMVEALGLVTLADDRNVEMPFAGPLVFTAVGRTMITAGSPFLPTLKAK
jgi:hypothetical protein